MVSFGKDISYEEFESSLEATEVSNDSYVRRAVNLGFNAFWLLPLPEGSEGKSPFAFFNQHFTPSMICGQARPIPGMKNKKSFVERGAGSGAKMEQCPRCVYNFQKNGFYIPEGAQPDEVQRLRENWKAGLDYKTWREGGTRARVSFAVIPIDFLIDKKVSRRDTTYEWREDAAELLARFQKEYEEFMKTPEWTERKEGTWPGFEFEYNGENGKKTTCITGISVITWTMHELISGGIFDAYSDGIKAGYRFDGAINTSKTKGEVSLAIPGVLWIERESSGKEFHKTAYSSGLDRVEGELTIPQSLIEIIVPNLPDTWAITLPPSKAEIKEVVKKMESRSSSGARPDCFGIETERDLSSDKCSKCAHAFGCRDAIKNGVVQEEARQAPRQSAPEERITGGFIHKGNNALDDNDEISFGESFDDLNDFADE